MKKLAIYLLFALFLIPAITEAKIWRVNNNPRVVADYNNITTGLMGLYVSGDTIHLEPSATDYIISDNIFTFNDKYVTIIGNGHDHFIQDGYQQDILQSTIASSTGTIFINSKIKFIGIVFNSPIVLNKLLIASIPRYVTDVFFEGCYTQGIDYNGTAAPGYPDQINGLHFSKSLIQSLFQIDMSADPSNSINNFSLENSIITGTFKIDPMPILHDVIVVRNNVFMYDYMCFEAYWANNIFLWATAISPSNFDGGILKNNIFARPAFTTNALLDVNNQFGVNMATVLVTTGLYTDLPFTLVPGSPAIGAGVPNGITPVDCGLYGGPNPYKKHGMPAIPSIYELQVPVVVNSGTNANINLKARSNN